MGTKIGSNTIVNIMTVRENKSCSYKANSVQFRLWDEADGTSVSLYSCVGEVHVYGSGESAMLILIESSQL